MNRWLCLFAKDPSWWEESNQALWGCHDICPFLPRFHVALVTWPELSTLSHSGAWGDARNFQGNMAFLLIVPEKTIQEEVAFSLTMVWANPYQAHLSSVDEVAKKLTLLINFGDNWAYNFVWLNKDAQHVPLPKEGHLSTMIDSTPSRNACQHLHQLEVHQLLQCGDWVVYPDGLNGSLEPVLTFLSGALVQGMNMLEPACKPSFLSVDLPQFTLGDCSPKVSAPCRTSTPTPPSHLTMECPQRQTATPAWPLRSKSF